MLDEVLADIDRFRAKFTTPFRPEIQLFTSTPRLTVLQSHTLTHNNVYMIKQI